MSINYKEMLEKAKEVSKNAYARYSNFNVGACILTGSGKYYTGCNMENASYGLALCAERNAISTAVANGERVLRAVAIYSPNADNCSPCGACRQVIWEFADRENGCEIILEENGEPKIYTIKELLPLGFDL